MKNPEKYRKIIKSILTQYYQTTVSQVKTPQKFEVSDRFGFAMESEDKKLVQHITIYICIKDSKVWVEEDSTDLCVVDDLLSEGIPQNQIVLGFHHPSKRVFTEFAST